MSPDPYLVGVVFLASVVLILDAIFSWQWIGVVPEIEMRAATVIVGAGALVFAFIQLAHNERATRDRVLLDLGREWESSRMRKGHECLFELLELVENQKLHDEKQGENLRELSEKCAHKIKDWWQNDREKYLALRSLWNFFDDLGFFAQEKVLDTRHIKEIYSLLLAETYLVSLVAITQFDGLRQDRIDGILARGKRLHSFESMLWLVGKCGIERIGGDPLINQCH